MPDKKDKKRKAIETLLGSPQDVNSPDSEGWTPLMIASSWKPLQIVRATITAGADPNKADDEGFTPLMCASVEGRTDVIKFLLQQGAKVDATDGYGRTALSRAATKGDFHEAAEVLISAGAKVNCADKGGFTPLMRAALMKHPRCFSTLIIHGADVRIKHPQLGTTALDMAKKGSDDQMSQLANRVEQERSPRNS